MSSAFSSLISHGLTLTPPQRRHQAEERAKVEQEKEKQKWYAAQLASFESVKHQAQQQEAELEAAINDKYVFVSISPFSFSVEILRIISFFPLCHCSDTLHVCCYSIRAYADAKQRMVLLRRSKEAERQRVIDARQELAISGLRHTTVDPTIEENRRIRQKQEQDDEKIRLVGIS